MSPSVEGLLLVDKPEGPTSHDIVDRVRRITGQGRVGHAGTLDPPASGLLPLLLGRATRLLRFLPSTPKRYEGALLLGLTTDTDDASGRTLRRHEGPLPDPERVAEAAARLTGKILQVPPSVSARKVGGQRLYRLARQGRSVAASPTAVEVYRFDVTPAGPGGPWSFVAEVSPGTYIRSLARDLGAALGCGGAVAVLRRTAVGPFSVVEAVAPGASPDERDRLIRRIVPFESIPLDVASTIRLGDADTKKFLSGAAVAAAAHTLDGLVRVLDPEGRLLGVGNCASEIVRPEVVFPLEPTPSRRERTTGPGRRTRREERTEAGD